MAELATWLNASSGFLTVCRRAADWSKEGQEISGQRGLRGSHFSSGPILTQILPPQGVAFLGCSHPSDDKGDLGLWHRQTNKGGLTAPVAK